MENKYKIAIDSMGGDKSLSVTIPAAISMLNKRPNLSLYLVGLSDKINNILKKYKYDEKRIEIVHASEVIGVNESPCISFRNKRSSSISLGIKLVKDKKANAFVSAGSTGALMATAKLMLNTIPNIERPAIVYPIPSFHKKTKILDPVYMLDLGANTKCSSEQLFQFGIMGSILAETLKNKKTPSVKLLNIGTEQSKGLENIKKAAEKFINCKNIVNYQGYIESNNICNAQADVIVCDGFTGNIALKSIEGVAKLIQEMLIKTFNKNIFSKIAMICAYPVLRNLKKKLNMNQYNGASLVGLKGIIIKSHGSTNTEGFVNAIKEAIKEIKYDVPSKIQLKIEQVMRTKEN